jgi:hypothetical protein
MRFHRTEGAGSGVKGVEQVCSDTSQGCDFFLSALRKPQTMLENGGELEVEDLERGAAHENIHIQNAQGPELCRSEDAKKQTHRINYTRSVVLVHKVGTIVCDGMGFALSE